MDLSPITDRFAVGEGIWTAERMMHLVRHGYTHIIDLQTEFDDTELASQFGIEVLWNPTDDDFEPKDEEFFRRSVEFALRALDAPSARLYVHCAAGIHRGPLTAAAILCALGYEPDEAVALIVARRPAADFPLVYLESLRAWAAGLPATPR
jgi:protein-tyrosine phosphatase